MHQEEIGSGISVDDMSEIHVLLEEHVRKEESLNKVGDVQSRKLKDKSKAEDIRQKALERYSETKKCKSTKNGNECDKKPKRQRRSAHTEPLVEFKQEKAKTERELGQQELDLRLEQQQNKQVMVTVLQQQQQTNQAIVSVIQKLIEKKE